MMTHDSTSDADLRDILLSVLSIAVVGASPNPARPSHQVLAFLLEQGYHAIPVNPGQAGGAILGQTVYASLADIPEPIDMVDIFRASDAAFGVVRDALALSPKPGVIWMQLGVRNDAAAALAREAGVRVVMDRCPKIEYARLGVTRAHGA